jgi:hypothetical protein
MQCRRASYNFIRGTIVLDMLWKKVPKQAPSKEQEFGPCEQSCVSFETTQNPQCLVVYKGRYLTLV